MGWSGCAVWCRPESFNLQKNFLKKTVSSHVFPFPIQKWNKQIDMKKRVDHASMGPSSTKKNCESTVLKPLPESTQGQLLVGCDTTTIASSVAENAHAVKNWLWLRHEMTFNGKCSLRASRWSHEISIWVATIVLAFACEHSRAVQEVEPSPSLLDNALLEKMSKTLGLCSCSSWIFSHSISLSIWHGCAGCAASQFTLRIFLHSLQCANLKTKYLEWNW